MLVTIKDLVKVDIYVQSYAFVVQSKILNKNKHMRDWWKKLGIALMIISLRVSPIEVIQSASGRIIVNDSVWKEHVEVGEDICELVRDDLNSCEYISYEDDKAIVRVHSIDTLADQK